MKIAIVSGSHRQPSQSLKVAKWIHRRIGELFPGVQGEVIDLGGNPYPLWDQGIWEGDPAWVERLAEPKRILTESDGLIVVSPEWHGQVPSGLKNFFLLFGPKELGHKPAMIVTVSASEGGSYPVAELRMSSYKNSRLCYIPEHVIVKHVESVFNDDPAQNDVKRDTYLRVRIDWTLGILNEYAKALKPVRESGVAVSPDFPFGM